jgi:murein DD-endopeptidase MepM/ murein hydrolase activator NlpD
MLRQLKLEERKIKARIAAAARRAAAAARRTANKHPAAGSQSSGGAGFLRPSSGYISSPFGYRRHPIYGYYGLHDGVDIAAPCGTTVRAPLNGRVLSRYYSDVYGNRLFIGLGIVNGRYLTAVYNHLAQSSVARGSSVRRGQSVGMVGDTGWSTGCHLHFTVLAGGRAVDPEPFF